MLFLIRFWRSLTKKYSVESAKYQEKCCLLVLTVSEVFYSWIRIFWIGSRFLADPDRGKKPGSKTLMLTTSKFIADKT